MAGLHLVSDSENLGWGLRNLVFNKFPDDADVTGPDTL